MNIIYIKGLNQRYPVQSIWTTISNKNIFFFNFMKYGIYKNFEKYYLSALFRNFRK